MKKTCLLVLVFLIMPLTMMLSACGNIEFKIKFIVDGQEYAVVNTVGNEIISMPENPIKDEYQFDGWYWDENVWQNPFTANSLLNQPLNSDMRVYAKWTNGEQSQNSTTDASFSDFEFVENETYSRKVDNDVSILNFSNIVQVGPQSTWTLYTDIYANNSIPSKIATLEIGDNTYYVLVTAKNNDVKLYTLNIRRLPLYTVTYQNSLGTNLKTIQVQEEDYVDAIDLDEITGYTFDSWRYDFTQPIMNNTTIIAKYNANQYKIIYHSNFGEDEIIEENVYYDQIVEIKPKNAFIHNGYNCICWNSQSDNHGTTFRNNNNSIKYNYTNDIDLYAIWNIITYSINYTLNGGKFNSNLPYSYNVEMNNIELCDIGSKQYYDFDGWYLDNEKITEIDTQLCKNILLIARFTPTVYQIDYVLNGGVNNTNNPAIYTIETLPVLLKPAIFENESISRWYLEYEFNNRITKIENMDYGNLVLYARAGFDGYDTCIINDDVLIELNYGFIDEFDITKIIIPEGVSNIKSNALINNPFIETLILPDSIIKLENGFLSGCSSLKSLTLPFIGYSRGITLYDNTANLGYFFGSSQFDNGTVVLQYYGKGTGSSYYCIPNSLEEVILKGKVTYGAFSNCRNIKSIILSNNIKSIPNKAFYDCESLVNISLPNSVKDIGDYAFYHCTLLTNIFISSNVNNIGEKAFRKCTNIGIFCQVESKPSGWVTNWNPDNRPVYWGISEEEYLSIIA